MNSMLNVVAVQIVGIWSLAGIVYLYAAKRDRRAPIDHIGIVWLGVFALYATLPALLWLVRGGSYLPYADPPASDRMISLQPTISEVVYLLNIALAYICSFACVYMLFLRTLSAPAVPDYEKIANAKLLAAVLIIACASVFELYSFGAGILRASDSYTDSYLAIAELPTLYRQLIHLGERFSSVATLVLLIGILQRWPRTRWLFIAYVVLALVSINTVGSRAGIVVKLFTIVVIWHVLVRPVSNTKVFFGSLLGLTGFMMLGALRSGGVEMFWITGMGEFDTLWGNAIELLHARNDGDIDIAFTAQYSELFAFIPSQLLWFEKTSLSIWFLDSFYPRLKEIGGGMAFGAISQVVIGGGIVDAALRGSILGGLAGMLIKWIRKKNPGWWHLPVYVYIAVHVFQCVRDTSFRLWGDVLQLVLPAIVLIVIMDIYFYIFRYCAKPQCGYARYSRV